MGGRGEWVGASNSNRACPYLPGPTPFSLFPFTFFPGTQGTAFSALTVG